MVELSPICRLIGTGHDMTGSGCGTKDGLDEVSPLPDVAFIWGAHRNMFVPTYFTQIELVRILLSIL